MKKPTLHKGHLFMILGILILLGSGLRHASLIDQRKEQNLQQVSPENTTPLVTLTTVAFGGFRGLVADALWVRASKLQETGEYFELVQIANWITQLEPRVPEVWSFQAWNLAYNISVLFPEFEDRWRWVSHGIDLLTKQGRRHNPNSASLHWDIGWMYQHKVGMEFDLAHLYYKKHLAEQIERALPDGQLSEKSLSPEATQILTSEFSLDVEAMRNLQERFGSLDWRIPETHSLYWATQGLTQPASSFESRSLNRMVLQSLAVLMRNGNLVHDSDSDHLITLPKPELIPVIADTYSALFQEGAEYGYLGNSYQNFLYHALLLYAELGQLSESLELYSVLAEIDEGLTPGREPFQAFIENILSQPPESLTRSQAMTRVVALLQSAADPEITEVRSRGLIQMAKQAHRLYQQSRQNEEHLKRTGLPPFEEMQGLLSQVN